MKHAVNAYIRTGLVRTLLSLSLAMVLTMTLVAGVWVHDCFAATVRYEVLPDRDRVTVTLSKEEGFAGDVKRVEPTGLLLDLGVATAGMGLDSAPENSKFFQRSEPRGRAIGFYMKTAAFGFVVTRPDDRTVIINAFADPLGERWTPQGLAEEPQENAGTSAPNQPSSGQPSPDSIGQEVPGSPRTPVSSVPVDDAYSRAVLTDVPGVARGTLSRTFTEWERPVAPSGPAPQPAPSLPAERPSRTPSAAPSGVAGPDTSAGSGSGDSVTVFRSRINMGGPADWIAMHPDLYPQAASGSGTVPGTGSPGTRVPAGSVSGDAPPASPRTPDTPAPPSPGLEVTPISEEPAKVYVDEKGNPVPPPPDPEEALAAVRADIRMMQYANALEKVEPLLLHPELSREQTEEVLHLYAEMLFMANQDKLLERYDAIVSATTTAMNYNQDSPRNPGAYLRLGYINLKVGNLVEANAYFSRLRRQYPLDENIPLTYYYWGEYYYDHNQMQKAADEFQYIVSNHSESRFARDASIGLARSYVALGYFQEAFDIIDYVERRWPRLYLESPPVLELMGDVGYRLGKLDFALDKYMLYYNLLPSGPNADVILTRIGDVFARQRQLSAAKTAYTEAEQRFPDRDGGLVAMMRLAETGINDLPEVQTMMSVFQGTRNIKAADIYRKIIRDHPESDLVPLAQLKLGMWYLANKEYEKALEQCTELAQKYPQHELAERAKEVAMKAFEALAAEGARQNRPGQVLSNWEDNPLIKTQEESLSPESRIALGYSMLNQNDPDGALNMVAPLLRGAKIVDFSEQALVLALSINLDYEQWEAIERLGEQVALWELTDKVKIRLDYATALARENLGKSGEAAPVWTELAQTGELDQKQQAYAEYFIAREAESARRLQDAYTYGRSSLNRFLQMAQENPAQADTGKINALLASLMDICETSGRYKEALDYANRYMDSLAPDDPQRQGLLFRLAGIYRKQGDTTEWRKTLTDLAQQYPDSVHGRAAASTLRSSQLAEDAAQFAPGGQL